MSSETHDPQMKALESALMGLVPLAGGIHRDAILFRAGQTSVQKRKWLWPLAATASTLVATAFGLILLFQPEAKPVERVVIVHVPQQAPVPETPREVTPSPEPAALLTTHVQNPWSQQAEYLRLREQVIRWGVEALPCSHPTAVDEPPPGREHDLPTRPTLFPRNNSRLPGGSL